VRSTTFITQTQTETEKEKETETVSANVVYLQTNWHAQLEL